MLGCGLYSFFTLIPATILLTISFFVLVVLRKIEARPLKVFGYIIAVLLWIGSLLIVSSGINSLSAGYRHGPYMKPGKAGRHMRGMYGSDMLKQKGMMKNDAALEAEGCLREEQIKE